jgi:hypothetical protein
MRCLFQVLDRQKRCSQGPPLPSSGSMHRLSLVERADDLLARRMARDLPTAARRSTRGGDHRRKGRPMHRGHPLCERHGHRGPAQRHLVDRDAEERGRARRQNTAVVDARTPRSCKSEECRDEACDGRHIPVVERVAGDLIDQPPAPDTSEFAIFTIEVRGLSFPFASNRTVIFDTAQGLFSLRRRLGRRAFIGAKVDSRGSSRPTSAPSAPRVRTNWSHDMRRRALRLILPGSRNLISRDGALSGNPPSVHGGLQERPSGHRNLHPRQSASKQHCLLRNRRGTLTTQREVGGPPPRLKARSPSSKKTVL